MYGRAASAFLVDLAAPWCAQSMALGAPARPMIVVAGNPRGGFAALDGGPASGSAVGAVAIAPRADGSLLTATGGTVRQVGLDGRIATVAGRETGCSGSCQENFSGDGGPASRATFNGLE